MSSPPSDSSQPSDSVPLLGGDPREPVKIEFADPHLAAAADMQEAEVSRVRTLQGGWRWVLIVAAAVTILLCVNQQFSLQFFLEYTQLNTEYFYLLIALMLPFTFLIFPNSESSPLDRIPWYDILFFVLTFVSSIVLMRSVRKAAEAGWEFGGAPNSVIAAGLVLFASLGAGWVWDREGASATFYTSAILAAVALAMLSLLSSSDRPAQRPPARRSGP